MLTPPEERTVHATFPDHAHVVAELESLAAAHPQRLALRRASSSEGRPLLAAVLTDPGTPAADKHHALIVAGRHGNEESGRGIALALLEWLLDDGRELLAEFVITVLPNANPDACACDGYRHPTGPDVGGDLDQADPLPESRFIEALAEAHPPDLVMDLHACGHVGCSHDMALTPETRPYTEDATTFLLTCEAMCGAAQRRTGIPQLHHPMRWWDANDHGICARYYRRYKALAILTETAESNATAHPWPLRIASGLAKIQRGLEQARDRHPRLPQAGYATDLVLGGFHLGLVAIGCDAAARRTSRIAIWRRADDLTTLGADALPEDDLRKRIAIVNDGPAIAAPIGLQLQLRHAHAPRRLLVDGALTPPVATWRDGPSTLVVAPLPQLRSGRTVVEFDCT